MQRFRRAARTRENVLHLLRTVGRATRSGRTHYEIENVVEKPTPTEAEQKPEWCRPAAPATTSALRHARPDRTVMDCWAAQVGASKPTARIELSPRWRSCGKERYLALEVQGVRYNTRIALWLAVRATRPGSGRQRPREILSQWLTS